MAFINYVVHIAILVCIYSILAGSLNLAVGFAGLMNLGHIAFFGIGAYTSALLGLPSWISIIMGGLAAAVSGIILALPTSRLKGDYLALSTLGFAFIVGSIARNWTSLTRGALGIPGIEKLVSGNNYFLIIAFAVAASAYAVFFLISKSNFGRTIQAIRDDELGAKMLGKNTLACKTIALSTSAFFAGIAGGLFAHYITFIDPSIFSIGDIILLFSMIIVGGLASVKGSVVGTLIILLLPEPLRFIGFPSSIIGPMREIIFALLLLIILLYSPKGIFGKVDLS